MELRRAFCILRRFTRSTPILQKQHVRSLFNAIAFRYDLLNHLLSGGVDLYWRRKAVEILREMQPKRILDVATGTADFAIASLRLNPEKVVGIDIAGEMLERGRSKLAQRGLASIIALQIGEAEDIQFETGTFDAAIVAFGARNFENLERGLAEMQRVLRNGGRIVVLEFSRPRHFPFRQIYLFYFLKVLPFIGSRISGHDVAYTYLPETVMKFPEGADFLALLQKAGFKETRDLRLTFGIVSIYSGIK